MRELSLLLGRVIESNFGLLRLPYKLTLMLTYRCNFKCKICNVWKIPHKEGVSCKELQLFFKKNQNFLWINVSGGEIFMRPDIEEIMLSIISESRNLCILNFPTNGYFTEATVQLVQKILDSCRAYVGVTVSIDGVPDLNDKIRGIGGAWEKAVRTYQELRKIKNRRLAVRVGYTLQPLNVHDFHRFFIALKARVPGIEVKDIHYNIYHYSAHYYKTKGRYEEGLQREMLDSLEIINKQYLPFRIRSPFDLLEHIYRKNVPTFVTKGISPIPCQALSASCFIDPLWNVYPCAMYDYPLGSLRDYGHDLKELWNSNIRDRVLAEIHKGACPQCWTPCEAYQSILASCASFKKK